MKKVKRSKVDEAIRALKSLIDDFNPDDREEMKTRADVLTSALFDTGLVDRAPDDYLLGLDYAVKSMRMKSSKLIGDVKSFYRALSSYDDDEDMYAAQESLETFGPVLLDDLKQARNR